MQFPEDVPDLIQGFHLPGIGNSGEIIIIKSINLLIIRIAFPPITRMHDIP
jgi:hypothetical protein